MVWPLVAAAAASSALSIYGSAQQARAAKDSAKARMMANAREARQVALEAQGRRLINLERLVQADSAITASSAARGVDIGSASNLAMMRGNRAKRSLDDLSINANMQNRIANLWADTGAGYRQAALQTQMAGINAFKSAVGAATTIAGGMGGSPAGGTTGQFTGAGSLTPKTTTWTGANNANTGMLIFRE